MRLDRLQPSDVLRAIRIYLDLAWPPSVEKRPSFKIEDLEAAASTEELLSFFDFPHVERLREVAPEGGVNAMHVATPISRKNLALVKEKLDAAGAEYGEEGGSLYVPEPNGLTIELLPEDLVPEQRLDL